MAQGAVIHVAPEQPTRAVCVLGTAVQLDVHSSAPEDCRSFSIAASPGVVVEVTHGPPIKKRSTASKWPLVPGLEVSLQVKAASSSTDDQKVQISYYGPKTSRVQALLYLTGVEISLLADVTRTGKATCTRAMTDKRTWTWGPHGQGAILLVNCDKDNPKSSAPDCEDERVLGHKDLQDMTLMTLSTKAPEDFFTQHRLLLHVAKAEMEKVRVFQATRDGRPARYKAVLGPQKPSHCLKLRGGQHRADFYVEGRAFADASFPGLVSLGVSLLDSSNPELPDTLLFQDSVVFRVAPWIMTPNTQPPQEVYVSRISDNEGFLKSVAALAKKAKCTLTVSPEEENMDDQWMQDEMEFGYIQAPHKTLPVVFDSPRDRGLKDFPIRRVMGPNMGYVTRGLATEEVTGLDSFGNLEVSPPVVVGEKQYPLGRILIGNSSYPSKDSRDMHEALRDFLRAQRVQAPVELYSDWLSVGHVDEFLSFVPAPDRKGFRLLLASPRACYRLFQKLQQEGHGEALLFQGVQRRKQQTIKAVLSNKVLKEQNDYAQSCIDWNRGLLKRELGLAEGDIVDLPQLFKLTGNSRATLRVAAFFPNMVNMLVLGKHLGIPKPFGPLIHGRCCLEERVRALLEPLGLRCVFIDDFASYHLLHGEVHCGTNVRRQPFAFKWWHMQP
ncbi:protein-arginine deiminase type-4-like [Perognathus longimembris pacificus]|uniref:protein-arginine deiminase type-4-like n=1 Tax=Perognathus longimembris pacificus TaxID=214514 RepID=UPI00201A0F88|nr:protein-arginine deiminase type-4-like [Perognathus longimembris pacificus]